MESAAILLRIFLDENDRYGNKPLYMAVVDALRLRGFTGATVLKGIEGYGIHRSVHSARVMGVELNLPIVIEVIEVESRIDELMPTLREMIPEGLLTLENVRALRLRKGDG